MGEAHLQNSFPCSSWVHFYTNEEFKSYNSHWSNFVAWSWLVQLCILIGCYEAALTDQWLDANEDISVQILLDKAGLGRGYPLRVESWIRTLTQLWWSMESSLICRKHLGSLYYWPSGFGRKYFGILLSSGEEEQDRLNWLRGISYFSAQEGILKKKKKKTNT